MIKKSYKNFVNQITTSFIVFDFIVPPFVLATFIIIFSQRYIFIIYKLQLPKNKVFFLTQNK
jgi:hypothetical protein